MRISICGSVSHFSQIFDIKTQLETLGFEVFTPIPVEGFDYDNRGTQEDAQNKIQNDLIRKHFHKIDKSDAILVVNFDKNNIPNYIGGNTFLEVGYAFSQHRDIFLYNSVPNLPYTSELLGMQPTVIHQDLKKIVKFYDQLPKIYVASTSQLKLNAVANGACHLQQKYSVQGYQTDSQVSAQPTGFAELYQGAKNRLTQLQKQSKNYAYLIALESGQVQPFPERGFFDIHLALIQDPQGRLEVGLTGSVEFPPDMTSEVPELYPDYGLLVQQKFAFADKDPILYLTQGRVSRAKLLQDLTAVTLARF